MTKLPKKLNNWTKTKKIGEDYLVLWESVVEIKQKQDEIINYLQEEASKKCIHYMVSDGEGETCFNCGRHTNIRGQEASKGECKPLKLKPEDIAGKYNYEVDINKSVPMEKDCDCLMCNPPEHEEWEHGYKEFWASLDGMSEWKQMVRTKDYIRDNFVSKEKIKRVFSENRFAKPRTDYESANNDTISGLLKSLGLGD